MVEFFYTYVDSQNRVVIPKKCRTLLGIRPGSELVMLADRDCIHVFTKEIILRRRKGKTSAAVGPEVDLVRELIEEQRKRDAERE
jgi:AbrB family looped-hinge helix DNA binding protein